MAEALAIVKELPVSILRTMDLSLLPADISSLPLASLLIIAERLGTSVNGITAARGDNIAPPSPPIPSHRELITSAIEQDFPEAANLSYIELQYLLEYRYIDVLNLYLPTTSLPNTINYVIDTTTAFSWERLRQLKTFTPLQLSEYLTIAAVSPNATTDNALHLLWAGDKIISYATPLIPTPNPLLYSTHANSLEREIVDPSSPVSTLYYETITTPLTYRLTRDPRDKEVLDILLQQPAATVGRWIELSKVDIERRRVFAILLGIVPTSLFAIIMIDARVLSFDINKASTYDTNTLKEFLRLRDIPIPSLGESRNRFRRNVMIGLFMVDLNTPTFFAYSRIAVAFGPNASAATAVIIPIADIPTFLNSRSFTTKDIKRLQAILIPIASEEVIASVQQLQQQQQAAAIEEEEQFITNTIAALRRIGAADRANVRSILNTISSIWRLASRNLNQLSLVAEALAIIETAEELLTRLSPSTRITLEQLPILDEGVVDRSRTFGHAIRTRSILDLPNTAEYWLEYLP